MSQTGEFAKVLKYGKCDSSTHGRCESAASKHRRSCPRPRIDHAHRLFCNCCEVCYGHCKEEANQNHEDLVKSFKDWSSFKNRTKRNIKDKITKWCGST